MVEMEAAHQFYLHGLTIGVDNQASETQLSKLILEPSDSMPLVSKMKQILRILHFDQY